MGPPCGPGLRCYQEGIRSRGTGPVRTSVPRRIVKRPYVLLQRSEAMTLATYNASMQPLVKTLLERLSGQHQRGSLADKQFVRVPVQGTSPALLETKGSWKLDV